MGTGSVRAAEPVRRGTGADDGAGGRHHVLAELGFAVRRRGDELQGAASVTSPMHVPGTECLRTSILAFWVDMFGGLLAAEAVAPRVPVTLDLDVHLYGPAPASGTVRGTGTTVKKGRSVFVAGADFTGGDGRPVASGAASFMVAPDPGVRQSSLLSVDAPPAGVLLSLPLAARVGPLVATAQVHRGLGRVELRDVGSDERLSAVATARVFDR